MFAMVFIDPSTHKNSNIHIHTHISDMNCARNSAVFDSANFYYTVSAISRPSRVNTRLCDLRRVRHRDCDRDSIVASCIVFKINFRWLKFKKRTDRLVCHFVYIYSVHTHRASNQKLLFVYLMNYYCRAAQTQFHWNAETFAVHFQFDTGSPRERMHNAEIRWINENVEFAHVAFQISRKHANHTAVRFEFYVAIRLLAQCSRKSL